jgi:hypothetical protein
MAGKPKGGNLKVIVAWSGHPVVRVRAVGRYGRYVNDMRARLMVEPHPMAAPLNNVLTGDYIPNAPIGHTCRIVDNEP